MTLKATTETLKLITTAAVPLDYHINYADLTTTATDGTSEGLITTATTTTILSAPAASTQRIVLYASFVNRHASSTQTFVTVLKDYVTVGVKENSKESIELSVFPNPSNSFINFNTASLEASKIIAYDVTGKIVLTEIFENGKVKLDVSNFIGGIYLYTVIDKNNQTLKSGKFNVTK